MQERTGIDLLVPGLLGPMSALREIDVVPGASSLEQCLSRADAIPVDATDYATTIFHLFDLDAATSGDLPTASFCRIADGGEEDAAYWLQASPVHLRQEGDGLLLFDAGVLGLSQDETQQLADMVQAHFSDRGWRLEMYTPQRWYLALEEQPDIQTFPLTDVIGRNIDSFLPRGKDAVTWHAMMIEAQMLLHSSQVNMLREGRGELPINGLWLHGGGRLQPIAATTYTAVFAGEAMARGMSLAAGVELVELPHNSVALLAANGKYLAVYEKLEQTVLHADVSGWVEYMARFNAWFEPLLDAVRSRRLDHINIYPCNGKVYQINAGVLRRFWRRTKPLRDFVAS